MQIKRLESIIALYNEPILVGIKNIGNNCYINSIFQCLSNTKKLIDYFLNSFENSELNKIKENMYYQILQNFWSRDNNKKEYSPFLFKEPLNKENPLFAGNTIVSKDLVNYLLARYRQELNIINKESNYFNNITKIKQIKNYCLIYFPKNFPNSIIYFLVCSKQKTNVKDVIKYVIIFSI